MCKIELQVHTYALRSVGMYMYMHVCVVCTYMYIRMH